MITLARPPAADLAYVYVDEVEHALDVHPGAALRLADRHQALVHREVHTTLRMDFKID